MDFSIYSEMPIAPKPPMDGVIGGTLFWGRPNLPRRECVSMQRMGDIFGPAKVAISTAQGVVGILASPRTAAFVVGPKELHTDPRWLVITMCHDVKGSPLRQREFPSMSSPFGPCHFSLTPPRPSANQVIASYVPGRSHGREA